MNHQTWQLPQGDVDALFLQSWNDPDVTAKAVVLIVHGLGEHSGRYTDFASYLVSQGFSVAALDLPGHGKSSGLRGYISRFDLYRKAVEQVTSELRKEHADLPIYLLGHSMGGLVSATTLLTSQNQYAGCALSGGAFDTVDPPGTVQQIILRVCSRLFPGLGVLELDAMDVSRDPEVVSRYSSDPLNYRGKFSARLVVELFKAMSRLHDKVGQIELPLLIMHGEADRLTPWQGSQAFHDGVGSKDKTLKLLPGLYHEILNEPERQEVYTMISDWLSQQLSATANSVAHQDQNTA